MTVLYHSPGQQVMVVLETKDDFGVRADPTTLPSIVKIVFPSLTNADSYPKDMVRLETGIYYHKFTLPTGAAAVGSYLVDISYLHPTSSITQQQIIQVVVSSPFGNYS